MPQNTAPLPDRKGTLSSVVFDRVRDARSKQED